MFFLVFCVYRLGVRLDRLSGRGWFCIEGSFGVKWGMMGCWVGNLFEVDYVEESWMCDVVVFYCSGYEKVCIDIIVDVGL